LFSLFCVFFFAPIFIVAAEIEARETRKVTSCDKVASSIYDYERVADPVLEIENLSLAKSFCMNALDQDPENPRLLFLVGRILDLEERPYWEMSPGESYFRRAAEKGYIAADFMLGEINNNVWGRTRFRRAFFSMLKAARAGHLEAMGRLSLFLGRRSAQNFRQEILELTKKAIALGHADAMAYLARGYIFILAETDRHEEAINLLYEAERRGSLEASVALGQLQTYEAVPAGIRTYIPENTFGGLRRLLKAAEKGNKRGAFVLGVLYSGTTFAIPRNREKMIHWLCRSGRRGQYMVAELLDEDVTKYRCPRTPLHIERAG